MVYSPATAEDYRRQLEALLPPGPVWPRDQDGILGLLIEAFGAEMAKAHADALGLLTEIIPSSTSELLPDWEGVAGLPDECSPLSLTETERRFDVLARLNSLGGASASYFESVSAALGFTTAAAVDHPQFRAGFDQVGIDPLIDDLYALTWTVQVDVTGKSPAQIAALRCVLEKLKPEHTLIEFIFTTTATDAWTDGSDWTDGAVGWVN